MLTSFYVLFSYFDLGPFTFYLLLTQVLGSFIYRDHVPGELARLLVHPATEAAERMVMIDTKPPGIERRADCLDV